VRERDDRAPYQAAGRRPLFSRPARLALPMVLVVILILLALLAAWYFTQ
jgi:hypothetical protein